MGLKTLLKRIAGALKKTLFSIFLKRTMSQCVVGQFYENWLCVCFNVSILLNIALFVAVCRSSVCLVSQFRSELRHRDCCNALIKRRGGMSRNEDAMMHLNWARQAEKQGDFLGARMGYLKCVESLKQAGDAVELEKATKEYEAFVRRDPIFDKLLSVLLPLIEANPGILQSNITKQVESMDWAALYGYARPVAREDVYYALYFADKFGRVTMTKKGRSYELRAAG